MVQSDFVSGNESRGWSTPAGVYPLTYKQRNATLKGENYATPVSYWMPFNGGIGMHDAYWRSSFGGKIYKTNGSHGCINLPPAVAKTVYENISAGMPGDLLSSGWLGKRHDQHYGPEWRRGIGDETAADPAGSGDKAAAESGRVK